MEKFDQSREIALFIDKLRIDRKISIDDFLVDIVSTRQYRRYLSGVSTLSFLILNKLAKRLGFIAEYIIMELETEKLNQNRIVNNLYSSIANKDLISAKKLFEEIDINVLITENDILLYKHCVNLFSRYTNQITEIDLIAKTKELINYTNLINKKVFSTSELLVLTSFLNLEKYDDFNSIANILVSYVKTNVTVVSGHNIKIIALVLEELTRYYSILEDYDKMLYYAEKGIDYSLAIRSFYLLDRLYYFAGAAAHYLQDFEKRDNFLYKCYNVSLIEGNAKKTERYKELFKKRFDIEI